MEMKSDEELEAEVAALEARVRQAKEPQRKRGRPKKTRAQSNSSEAAAKKIMRTSHGSKEIGAQGKSIIEKIEELLDKTLKKHKSNASDLVLADTAETDLMLGRAQGLAAALGFMRSSSMKHELQRAAERLGK